MNLAVDRTREVELERQKEAEIANLVADNYQKTQEMLGEFNEAQQLLKDKIRQLQNMWADILLQFMFWCIWEILIENYMCLKVSSFCCKLLRQKCAIMD